MTKEHQIHQSYILSGSLLEIEEQGSIKKEVSNDLPIQNILAATCKTISTVPWICIDGVKYKAEKCFIITDYVNIVLCFALLFKIVYLEKSSAFICKTVNTVEHNLHFNAYEICFEKEEFKIYQLRELFVHNVYQAHRVHRKYIPVKWSVGDIN